ncbi:MAG: hypothetical protein IE920_09875, partial [Thiotrichales bacterium]|nr:hypothetical protein [Thiotrichales bacterium]
NQTAEALEPWENLRAEVQQAITAYDQVTAAQRQTLDELTNEMIDKASQTFEQKVVELDKTISDLSKNLPVLTSSIDTMTKIAQNIERIPDRLKKSAEELTTTANELSAAARSTRPKLWRQALILILAGAVGAMLVATGQVALNRLV